MSKHDRSDDRLIVTPGTDIIPSNVEWLWPGHIPLGMLTLLIGNPGLGKSFVSLDIISRVSTARDFAVWPNKVQPRTAPKGHCIYATAEDSLSKVVRQRLDAMRGDPAFYSFIQGTSIDEDGMRVLDISRDVPKLQEYLDSHADVRLIVLDPISSYLGQTDCHKNEEVRNALNGLVALAERRNMAVILVTHENKSEKTAAVYRAAGSIAFAALPRCMWFVRRDKKNRNRRLLVCEKMSVAKEPPGLAFRTEDNRVIWEKGPILETADELAAEPANDGVSLTDAAKDWLEKLLLPDGEMLATDIFEMGTPQGFNDKTLQRARARSRLIDTRKKGFGKDSKSWWFAKKQGAQL